MAAPALLSHRLALQRRRAGGTASRLLASGASAGVLKLLAVGEMVGDKTPFVPNRTEPISLVGRAGMGALCGAAVAEWRGGSPAAGALTGAVAALLSTFVVFQLRTRAGRLTAIPDPVLGLVEDGVVLAAGSRLVRSV